MIHAADYEVDVDVVMIGSTLFILCKNRILVPTVFVQSDKLS